MTAGLPDVAGVVVPIGSEPEWSGDPPRLASGRLELPAAECWAWVAGRAALAYWSRWTAGSTRHMRGWFGGSDLATVELGGGSARQVIWSAARWLQDAGDAPSPAELAEHGAGVRELCRALGLDRTRGCPGSAAVALLRQLSPGEQLPEVPHDQQAWASGAILGGRAEVWRPGRHGELSQWDRRSAYLAHLTEPLPVARSGRWRERPDLRLEGISDALVEVDESCWVPPLPVRARCKGGIRRTVHPVGRMVGRWTHAELRAAADRGARIRSLGPGLEYLEEERCGPYRAVAERCWAARSVHEGAKRVGVALVGRMHSGLVQRRAQPITADDSSDPDALCAMLGSWDVVLGRGKLFGRRGPDVALYRDVLGKYPPHANLPAAATILARARIALLEVMEAQPGRIVSVATDGILLEGWDPPSWPDSARVGSGLGEWRLEAQAELGQVAGPLHYRLGLRGGGEKTRTAGVLRRCVDEFFRGRACVVQRPLPLAAGRRVGELRAHAIDPEGVEVTGGRVRGCAPVVDLVADGDAPAGVAVEVVGWVD